MSKLFYSLISFFWSLLFIAIGILGISVPWSAHLRTLLTHFIFDDAWAISLLGFSFCLVGLSIAAHMFQKMKRQYYRISSKNVVSIVDEAVIQTYLNTYWKHLFPKNEIPCHLNFKENKIHISVDLPYLPIQEQKPFLEGIRKDLINIFAKALGYKDEFFLSASFQNQ